MIVTEKEARQIECPAAMMRETSRCCLGSRCMAWQWRGWKVGDDVSVGVGGRSHFEHVAKSRGVELERLGACGLTNGVNDER